MNASEQTWQLKQGCTTSNKTTVRKVIHNDNKTLSHTQLSNSCIIKKTITVFTSKKTKNNTKLSSRANHISNQSIETDENSTKNKLP